MYYLQKSLKSKSDLSVLLNESDINYYWIGFLLADGSIDCGKNRLNFELSGKDADSVLKFAEYIKCNNIYHIKNNVKVNTQDSVLMPLIIKKYGFDSNKTYNPPPLSFFTQLSENLFLSLFIGYCDGDCSLLRNNNRDNSYYLSIEIHKNWINILKYFREFLLKYGKIPEIKYTKNNKYIRLRVFGYNIIKKLKLFALNHNLPYLKRKWDIIDTNVNNMYHRVEDRKLKIKNILHNKWSLSKIGKELNIKYIDVDWKTGEYLVIKNQGTHIFIYVTMLYFNLMIELYKKFDIKELEKIPFSYLGGIENDEHINYYKNNKDKLGDSYKRYMNWVFRYSNRCFICYSKNEKLFFENLRRYKLVSESWFEGFGCTFGRI